MKRRGETSSIFRCLTQNRVKPFHAIKNINWITQFKITDPGCCCLCKHYSISDQTQINKKKYFLLLCCPLFLFIAQKKRKKEHTLESNSWILFPLEFEMNFCMSRVLGGLCRAGPASVFVYFAFAVDAMKKVPILLWKTWRRGSFLFTFSAFFSSFFFLF